jgi:ABC-type multidrug transport system fused ATPase/permease subunit
MAGSELIHRVRLKTFACLLRQETTYFDRPENSSGAISVRLSSDAAALEEMVGTRLGAICEAVALSLFGFLFGIIFNWQLTMIVLFVFLTIIITAYLNIRLTMRLKKQSDLILRKANRVRSDFNSQYFIFDELNMMYSFSLFALQFAVEIIHNIRTIKQLSVEKEVLRQYTESIHQVYK